MNVRIGQAKPVPPAPNAPERKRRYAGVPLRPRGVRQVFPVTEAVKARAFPQPAPAKSVKL